MLNLKRFFEIFCDFWIFLVIFFRFFVIFWEAYEDFLLENDKTLNRIISYLFEPSR